LATYEVRIDASKPLRDQPETGHNRWHPDIEPIVACDPGDTVVLETRDALDGQLGPGATAETAAAASLDVVHPLTGPVYVNGAEAGDLLEVEILDVEPDSYGFTAELPGFGFLRDHFPDAYLANWSMADNWAVSEDIPGVRIPGHSFMGTIGLAPDQALMERATAREVAAAEAGGMALPPSPDGAVPDDETIAAEAWRTVPPRETGGNVDIKQIGKGAKLFFPVYAAGGLFSAGDAHFAQGDSECCGTAIEMRSTLHVRFTVHKGEAAAKGITGMRYSRDGYFVAPEYATPRRFYATTGLPITADGENRAEDLTLAATNALLSMIDYLAAERGYTRAQAYALCSVAVDLKVSQVVDVPNYLVSALLPLDIFTE
jgi:formamidase